MRDKVLHEAKKVKQRLRTTLRSHPVPHPLIHVMGISGKSRGIRLRLDMETQTVLVEQRKVYYLTLSLLRQFLS